MKRPAFHFAPAKNWMNDPNGTFFDGERYHLFYQYNPYGSEWGSICWAYAVSADLVNWTRRGLRIVPEKDTGEMFCFSGCTFDTGKGIRIAYTSIGPEGLTEMERVTQVICDADADFSQIVRKARFGGDIHPFAVRDWRDPFIFSYKGQTYMLLGGRQDVGRGDIMLYAAESEDLYRWKYCGVLFSREDDIIECPNAALFGDKMVLLYSSVSGSCVRYASGDFDGCAFRVHEEGLADHGNALYATNLSAGAGGRTVVYGWLRETLDRPSPDGAYSGCLAAPRTLELDGYTPVFRPAAEIGSLEREPLPAGARADCARVRFAVKEGDFVLLRAGGACARICVEDGLLNVIRTGTDPGADSAPLRMPVNYGAQADVLIDGTAAEIFSGGRAMSFRFYAQGGAPAVAEGFGEGAVRMAEAALTGEE